MKLVVSNIQSYTRIDKFLAREFFSLGLTRGEIIRNIRKGNALVNGKVVKPSYILKENDELDLSIEKEATGLVPNAQIVLDIIHQDENIIVINKPAGLQVHPSPVEKINTLANALVAQFPEIKSVNDDSKDSELRPGIIHRLDKDTSGLIVIARNQKAFAELKRAFQERKVAKQYLALVIGHLENKQGIIEKPLAKSQDYTKQVIATSRTRTTVRPAITEYAVLEEFADFSLIKATPKTGRTHQIRIHLASLGHPIIGDTKYAQGQSAQIDSIPRQMLHAAQLDFELFGQRYSFQAPLPADFANLLASLDPALTLH